MALIMGVILGVMVAVIRTAHDQQRPGRHNPILGLLNTICKVYTTVIRGTPMMVQLLIMGMRHLRQQPELSPWSAPSPWASTPALMWLRSSGAASCPWTPARRRPGALWV